MPKTHASPPYGMAGGLFRVRRAVWDDPRKLNVNLKLSGLERRRLDRMASLAGETRTDFVLRLIREVAETTQM